MTRLFGRLMCHLGYHWHEEWTRVATPEGRTYVSECERPGCGARDYVTERAR